MSSWRLRSSGERVWTDFLYFMRCTGRNQVMRQVRRLRKPRYAVAAFLGLAYFYLILGGWSPRSGASEPGAPFIAAGRSIGPLFLGLIAAWWWLWGGHRSGLVLTPAETHLLVPAPLRRRALVRFKILQAQLPILMSAVIGALFTRGAPLPWPLRLASLWVLLATLHQHQIAASLVHTAADEQGRHGIRRHLLPVVLFGTGFLALFWAMTRALGEIRAAASLEFAVDRLAALMMEPAPRIVLAPFRLLLAPVLAETATAWAPSFLLAVGVLGLHYLWIQRTDAAFEEGAAREGERRDARLTAIRAGGLGRLRLSRFHRPRTLARPLLSLDLVARPAYAIVWKNVLYIQRIVRPRSLLILSAALLLVLAPTIAGSNSASDTLFRLGVILLAGGGFFMVFGPLMVRNDLRMDLVNVQTLRTYPLTGRDVVVAAIAAATLVVCVVQIPLLTGGIALMAMSGRVAAATAVAVFGAGILAAPIMAALSVTIQNAIALLYPGWTRIGPADTGGMDAIGQNMLIMIGTILLLALTLIPPLLVAVVVGAPLTLLTPALSIPAAAAAALATAGGEVILLSVWLGRLYDRTDPVAAGLLR
jgi:ABC-2 type transport system permease protein